MKTPPNIEDHEKTVYVSVDCESDGPFAPRHSMLSLGAVAIDVNKKIVGKFNINFKALEGATQDTETMQNFWSLYPEAWEAAQMDQVAPEVGTVLFWDWIQSLKEQYKHVSLVAMPVAFDSQFISYYVNAFVGSHAAIKLSWLDVRSYVAGYKRVPPARAGKKYLPKRLFDQNVQHTHVAADDALEQGLLFINLLRENLGLKTLRGGA